MKKILIVIFSFILIFSLFGQTTIDELKAQLSKTNEALAQVTTLADTLMQENKDKDATISNNNALILQLQQALKDKDAVIVDLNKKLQDTITNDNKTIIDLKDQITADQKEISDLRNMIDTLIKQYELYKKINFFMIEGGYTLQGKVTTGLDYSFALWRLRFLAGIQYLAPIDFGIKVGIGISF